MLAASATSKSQFYQHFDDKADLVYDVITVRADEILSWQRLRLEKVDSFRGLYQWRDAIVQRCSLRRGLWGCELGSLAAELVGHRRQGPGGIGGALRRVVGDPGGGVGADARQRGPAVADIDARALATGLLAAVEGGYLLSQTAHDPRLMQTALDSAIEYVKTFRSAGSTA